MEENKENNATSQSKTANKNRRRGNGRKMVQQQIQALKTWNSQLGHPTLNQVWSELKTNPKLKEDIDFYPSAKNYQR